MATSEANFSERRQHEVPRIYLLRVWVNTCEGYPSGTEESGRRSVAPALLCTPAISSRLGRAYLTST
jgi:hypothetical protein